MSYLISGGPLSHLNTLFECDVCGDWWAFSGYPSLAPRRGHVGEGVSPITGEYEWCEGTVRFKSFCGQSKREEVRW